MSDTKITYAPRPDATPEAEASALGSAYRFILDCYAKKKGGPETAPDDRKEIDGSARKIVSQAP